MSGMNRPMKKDFSTPWCMDGEVMLWYPILHFSSLKTTQPGSLYLWKGFYLWKHTKIPLKNKIIRLPFLILVRTQPKPPIERYSQSEGAYLP